MKEFEAVLSKLRAEAAALEGKGDVVMSQVEMMPGIEAVAEAMELLEEQGMLRPFYEAAKTSELPASIKESFLAAIKERLDEIEGEDDD